MLRGGSVNKLIQPLAPLRPGYAGRGFSFRETRFCALSLPLAHHKEGALSASCAFAKQGVFIPENKAKLRLADP
jgi:hypothetical protein